MYSKNNGTIQDAGGTEYVGTHPEYATKLNHHTYVEEFVKVSPGVPFVRLTHKSRYIPNI